MAPLARVMIGTLLFALAGPTAASAQDGANAVGVCDGKFGLCRYVDRQTRQEIIPARYEEAMPFSEGLAAVSIDGRYGYIDARGEIVIAPKFDLAGEFYQGLAEILVGDKTGVIDRKGDIVVPPIFQRAIPLTKDVILASEGQWQPEKNRLRQELRRNSPDSSSKFGLYHVAGHWIRRPDLNRITPFDHQGRGLIWASESGQALGVLGLLASTGQWIVEPQYYVARPLADERAIVIKRVGDTLLYGAVDPSGQLVVPLQALQLLSWSNGWGWARENIALGKYALLDKQGAVIGGRYFDFIEPPKGDVAAVVLDGRHMGLDRAGNIVPHPDNGRVLSSCPSGIRLIATEGKFQVVNADGKPTAPYLFEMLNRPLPCHQPLLVRLGPKWSFVGVNGRLLFDPPSLDEPQDFEFGYAIVKQDGKSRIIDAEGRYILDGKFERYLGRREGLFHVEAQGRDLWLDPKGEEHSPPSEYVGRERVLNCGHGLRLAARDGLWGIVDADGQDVVAPRYRAIECFKKGVAWAAIDSNRQWCALGRDGALRPIECEPIRYAYGMMHARPEMLDQDPFENSVLYTRAYLEFAAGQRPEPPNWIPDGPPPVFIRP
ncbi:MAG: hypothetical protein JWN71_1939 [Xanthobacteraceae bacterium]|nr:hypothetical protein [Xanthobacteraceae bacterium]